MLLQVAVTAVAIAAADEKIGDSHSKCALHKKRGECILFRTQHGCAWDEPSHTCVAAVPCEERASDQCEFELTSGASWDATTNLCFFDKTAQACRHSDECFGLDGDHCKAAGCAWIKVSTPADNRNPPGPNVPTEVCTVPSPSASPEPRRPLAAATTGAERRTTPLAPKPSVAGPTVETTSGTVQGKYSSSGGAELFLGLPFAEAPVGDLRLAPPKTQTWNGVYEATSSGPSCTQALGYYANSGCMGHTRDGKASGACKGYSEDCLVLDIYTPASSASSSTNSSAKSVGTSRGKASSKPVMVWIHGGCFVSGSASGYDGTALAEAHDVVVVAIQYRLGAFGFLGGEALRTRDPSGSTGNWGLLDNVAALKWLSENIGSFGGDPDNVMLFGQSSGAGSISQLLGMQEAWPYYHKAVMESGSGSFWTYLPLEAAEGSYDSVLSSSSCTSAKDQVACLLEAGSSAISNAVNSVPCRDGCNWAPTIDGVLVKGKPLELASAGQLRPDTPILQGFNLNDGAMFVPGFPFQMSTMSSSTLKSYFSDRFGEEREPTLAGLFKVPGAWPGASSLSPDYYAAQACETDFSYSCEALWLTASATPGSRYIYQFSEPTSAPPLSFGGKPSLALHSDEIGYVFGTLSKPSEGQKVVMESMMSYWTNFAKTGDPNDAGDGKGKKNATTRSGAPLMFWPSWEESEGAMINITSSPVIASVPPGSYHGCAFFDEHWDFYSGCLPP